MPSQKTPNCRKESPPALQGLNQLRFLAAVLVFSQHSLSSSHADDWIDIAGIRIGRIGTAIFFLLSGFLSATTTRKPLTWLKDRLVLLFPSYWLVTIAGFLMAAVTATKSFDGWQVLSQLAGTGYFTHGDHIVNIATWFISPLLLLYAAVTTIRLTSVRIVAPLMIVGLLAVTLADPPDGATIHCHAVTFFMAFAAASAGPRFRTGAVAAMAASLLLLTAFQPEFRYGALASLLLLPALKVQRTVRFCNLFSGIAYEWFLVHGLCLAIVSHFTESPVLILAVGAVLSVVSAICLKSVVRRIFVLGRRPLKQAVINEAATPGCRIAYYGAASDGGAENRYRPADPAIAHGNFAMSETLPTRQVVELSS